MHGRRAVPHPGAVRRPSAALVRGRRSRRCSCTRAGSTSSATCSSSGSSGTTSRTRSAGCGSSSGTSPRGSRRRRADGGHALVRQRSGREHPEHRRERRDRRRARRVLRAPPPRPRPDADLLRDHPHPRDPAIWFLGDLDRVQIWSGGLSLLTPRAAAGPRSSPTSAASSSGRRRSCSWPSDVRTAPTSRYPVY